MLDLQGSINRIVASRRWSRAGAHLVVVGLVALAAATGVIGGRAHEFVTPTTASAAQASFPFNLVAIANAAESSSGPLSPIVVTLDPSTWEEPISREGDPSRRFGSVVGPVDVPQPGEAAETADVAATGDAGTEAPTAETVAAAPPAVAPLPPPAPGDPPLVWPVAGGSISQYYYPGHLGVDIAAPWGTPVVASASGTVTYAGWRNNGGGYVVEIVHDNGLITVYNHLSSIWVWPAQYVGRGEGIAAVGCTGLCFGSHVHYAVFVGYVAVNPLYYL